MPREIRTEKVRHRVAGYLAETEIPVIPSDAGPLLREGLSRRRYCGRKDVCRCGATRATTSPDGVAPTAGGGQVHLPFNHAPDCPAHEDILRPEIEAWANAGEVPGAEAG